jgi:hypothetical protein
VRNNASAKRVVAEAGRPRQHSGSDHRQDR